MPTHKGTFNIDLQRIAQGLKRKCLFCDKGVTSDFEEVAYVTPSGRKKTKKGAFVKSACRYCKGKGWHTEPESQEWVDFFTTIKDFIEDPDKVPVTFIDEGYY